MSPNLLNLSQQKTIFWATKCSSSFIFAASIILIRIIVSDHSRLKKTYHRILLLMGVNNTIISIATFIGSWAIPKDDEEATFGASGTNATCNFQGFVLLFCYISFLIDPLVLIVFSFISIKTNFQAKFTLKQEFCVYIISHGWSIIIPTVSLSLGLIGPSINLCLFNFKALHSEENGFRNPAFTQERTATYHLLLKVRYFEMMSFYFLNAFLLISLYVYVRWKETPIKSLSGKHRLIETARQTKSRRIRFRALLHALATLTTVPFLVCKFSFLSSGELNFVFYLITIILFPMCGVFNLIIYVSMTKVKNQVPHSAEAEIRASINRRLSYEQNKVVNEAADKTNVSEIRQNFTNNRQFSREIEAGKMTHKPEYEIYDGTNASATWRDFIDNCSLSDYDQDV